MYIITAFVANKHYYYTCYFRCLFLYSEYGHIMHMNS